MFYDDELKDLKQEDNYHFSIPFEYIEKNYGNDEYDISTTFMEIDVEWSDYNNGYVITYSVPEMYLINPDEGNGNEKDFYESAIKEMVLDELESLGVYLETIVDE